MPFLRRSFSCCSRLESCFSFSAVSSTWLSACCCWRAAIDRLVLIAKLVRVELEQVGEILGVRLLVARRHRRRCWPRVIWYSLNAASARCRCWSARCSGGSASTELRARSFSSATCISFAACGSSSAMMLNAVSIAVMLRSIMRRDERLDRFAHAPLREVERREVLAQPVRGRRLAIAVDVERAGDDLTLSLGQLARIVGRHHRRRRRPAPTACRSGRTA